MLEIDEFLWILKYLVLRMKLMEMKDNTTNPVNGRPKKVTLVTGKPENRNIHGQA